MLSKYLHCYIGKRLMAVFNALYPDPVYLTQEEWVRVKREVVSSEEREMLVEKRIYVPDSNREIGEFRVRYAPSAEVMTLYLILTRACNLRCEYCFEVERHGQRDYAKEVMTLETALKALNRFAEEINRNQRSWNYQVVLYGGEPLTNWVTTKQVITWISKMRDDEVLPKNLSVILNTNGTLVTEEIAAFLAEHSVTVAVSIDGNREIHDSFRVDVRGRGSFDSAIRGFKALRDRGVVTSVSMTISEALAPRIVSELQHLYEDLGFTVVGFNPLMGHVESNPSGPNSYASLVSRGLIDSYRWARDLGIYEDRMMRKVSSFVSLKPHIHDCCAYGQQLVVQPDGSVGNCHASAVHNFGNLDNYVSPREHEERSGWRQRLPIYRPECERCEAIFICGGGCAHGVWMNKGEIWNLDEEFCVHTKATMEFLVWDLYEKLEEGD